MLQMTVWETEVEKVPSKLTFQTVNTNRPSVDIIENPWLLLILSFELHSVKSGSMVLGFLREASKEFCQEGLSQSVPKMEPNTADCLRDG